MIFIVIDKKTSNLRHWFSIYSQLSIDRFNLLLTQLHSHAGAWERSSLKYQTTTLSTNSLNQN